MRVYFLGTAGWIPGNNETCCFMIEHDEQLFLLDAGTGMSNIRNYRHILEKYDTVHVILSHYHLDHTVGLIYLYPYIRDKQLRIYGPGKAAYPHTTSDYLQSLLKQEFFARSIDRFTKDVQCIDFPDETFYIGQTKINVKEQPHSSPSFRISLGDKLVYATDTAFQADAWKQVHAGILLHECWEYGMPNNTHHTSLWHLKNQLPTENFGRIFLIHHNPFWTDEDWAQLKKMSDGTNIEIAEDGMCITVN